MFHVKPLTKFASHILVYTVKNRFNQKLKYHICLLDTLRVLYSNFCPHHATHMLIKLCYPRNWKSTVECDSWYVGWRWSSMSLGWTRLIARVLKAVHKEVAYTLASLWLFSIILYNSSWLCCVIRTLSADVIQPLEIKLRSSYPYL